jgi:hypothetical protein
MIKFYVYIHYRLSDGVPFYVGKGCSQRDTVVWGRNSWWKRIVEKHGYYSERIEYFENEVDAFNKEKEIIFELRKQGISLCNLTDGGEGATGTSHSQTTKEAISLKLKGNTNSVGRAASSKQKASASNRTGSLHPNSKGEIYVINENGEVILKLNGRKEIEQNGFETASVYRCVSGKQKTHRGFKFVRSDVQASI